MKTKFNGILTLLLALVMQISFAQDRTISGTVSDETGPLPGVSILKKGTTQGTETDFDGNYTIKAKTGDVLVFSFVGMETVEKKVGIPNNINIILQSGNILDEVVVVGYGTTTKRSFTGTAKAIDAEVLNAKPASNLSQALAGEVSGVSVSSESGQPGSSSKVRIRGFGSVNGNRAPLYVVDGVPYFDSINTINPSDIASTTILKDAASTAIYGSRGANGVILITTKSGSLDKKAIEIDVRTGVNFLHLPRHSVIGSPEEYAELSWSALKNNGELLGATDPAAYANANLYSRRGISSDYNIWNLEGKDLVDASTGKIKSTAVRKYTPEKWADYSFQSAIRTEVNARLSGGNNQTKYFSSFGYLDDIGYSVNSSYKRYTTRLNLEHKPKEWLKAKANLNYSFGKTIANGQTNTLSNVFLYIDNMTPLYPVFLRDKDGKKVEDKIYGGYQYDYGRNRSFGSGENALANATYNLNRVKRHSLNGNFDFEFKLYDDLKFTVRYGASYYSFINDNIYNPFYGSYTKDGGALFKQNRDLLNQNFLKMLTYKKSFGDHEISALVAHENNNYKRQRNYLSVRTAVNLENGLDDPTNYTNSRGKPTGYTEEEKVESYFGQVNYDYNNKYYLSASLRRDGSSRFYKNKWGTFGSLGLGWIVTNEDFLGSSDYVNFLKLKASYGLVGDQTGKGFYQGQGGYDIDVDASGNISLPLRAVANEDISWETSKMFQVGLEFTLFNNILEGAIDFYSKRTEDQFFDKRLAPSSGDALITVNDGVLLNQGVEFDFTTHILRKKDLKLSFTVNGEMLTNKMLKMPLDETKKPKVLDQNGIFGRSEGYSIFDYYMKDWAGVDSKDGFGMWYLNYYDANNNGQIDSGEEIKNLTQYLAENPSHSNSIKETTTKVYQDATERYINKSVIPKIRGAFRLNANYKNFDFSAQFAYSLGGYSYDYVYAGLMHNAQVGKNNWHTDIRNSWKKEGQVTDVPRLFSNYTNSTTGLSSTNFNASSSRFLTSTDYLALNNAKIGYTLPNELIKKSGVSSVNISLSGSNLFLLSKRSGFNPMIYQDGESSSYSYSPLTNISLGVNVKF